MTLAWAGLGRVAAAVGESLAALARALNELVERKLAWEARMHARDVQRRRAARRRRSARRERARSLASWLASRRR